MFFSQADNLVNPVKRYKTLCYQELAKRIELCHKNHDENNEIKNEKIQ